jgi:hypothetical protein
MPKDRLPPNLSPGWQLDPPDPPADNHGNIAVPYILLPDNAMPLIPLTNIVTAYLVAKQINAFLRAL